MTISLAFPLLIQDQLKWWELISDLNEILSTLTCHVNASPLAFSESNSLFERGNEFLQSNNIRGRRPFTTGTPRKNCLI